MRMSQLFGSTLREVPAEADIASHQLLLRAGYIRQLGAGIFTLMPLGWRVIQNIEELLRKGMDSIAGQEMKMPVVHPADVWKETNRWFEIDEEMARFKDRNGHDMVLAMTHEEIVSDLARRVIHSYRQLPALVYHIQTKFRDDPRPRAGLVRVREFTMLDSYSLCGDIDQLDGFYQSHYALYHDLFAQCGLPVRAVASDSGMMGGNQSHEFMYLSNIGEDSLLFCSQCDYAANLQAAFFQKPVPDQEIIRPVEKVATPGMQSIDELSEYLRIPRSKTCKAVFYMAVLAGVEQLMFVFALVRGDMTLNETKLCHAISTAGRGTVLHLAPATEQEIRQVGAVPGYASALAIDHAQALVIADDLLPVSPNLVAGANEEGFHLLNVNYGRDFQADIVADIVNAEDGFACPHCGSPLQLKRGVEVGHIFKLGTSYSQKLRCTFLDEQGREQLVIMGSYGIGLGRLMACVAEEHHDDRGLVWPVTLAPYLVHLVLLHGRNQTAQQMADQVFSDLLKEGFSTLYDDREERAGVKFNDADLVGIPIRVTISERSLAQGGAEVKLRISDEKMIVALPGLVQHIHETSAVLLASLIPPQS